MKFQEGGEKTDYYENIGDSDDTPEYKTYNIVKFKDTKENRAKIYKFLETRQRQDNDKKK